ncbi:hypothetical protein R078138_00462 [Convivina praedatoris]|uniref:DUF1211 domain-containing protein n=1 Tax=Convivina praedatoris TaxID=2880963 RepID=A0ABN8HBV8_9LACO|nr:hypothetical protein LMG032447_00452 [Convivina sp. LMG 32447]CAH1852002.1 hypothetical protein R078138_00462 [Convivina sp. LMG 32447]CAH1852919.1 hypothetical protein R077815_00655 [Convivina sp. LMG 32447]
MNKERLATFIDAMLAIIMTILVLELEHPKTISLAGFWAMREHYFAYTLAFFGWVQCGLNCIIIGIASKESTLRLYGLPY